MNIVGATYLAVAGVVMVVVGLVFRFVDRVPETLRPVVMVLLIIFGIAPYSWLPWGLALILLAISFAVAPNPALVVLLLLASLFFLAGVVFIVCRPAWLQPREP
jgi:hypothetical protein